MPWCAFQEGISFRARCSSLLRCPYDACTACISCTCRTVRASVWLLPCREGAAPDLGRALPPLPSSNRPLGSSGFSEAHRTCLQYRKCTWKTNAKCRRSQFQIYVHTAESFFQKRTQTLTSDCMASYHKKLWLSCASMLNFPPPLPPKKKWMIQIY